MKHLLILCLLLQVYTTEAQISKASLRASGLTCALCSKAVFKSLSMVPSIDKVEANIENSTYTISFKQGLSPDLDALSRAVIDAGFSVDELKLVSTFNHVKLTKGAKLTIGSDTFQFLNGTDQVLQGEQVFTLVDKNFVSPKVYKKYSQTAGKAYQQGFENGKRIYHVVL
jgi:copper chaperone CopZ